MTEKKKPQNDVDPCSQTEIQTPALSMPRLEIGKTCPHCGKSIIEYDGWLNLVCPACMVTQGGGFT